ncbi:GNAT family N-acetyltransferase [Leifsonia sp. 2TAF2]|uniref:GNAT family N-acetyltransferase n=1 Tax=Leifsonia sp. 2TAF2 TaxID=3233009 RepID=UPI003F95E4E4
MAHLDEVTWPPAPIATDRLILRAAESRDREALLDLFSDPRVNEFVGGAEPREHLDELMPAIPGQRVGFFAVELDGDTIGLVTFDPRDAERQGHVRSKGGEAELGYLFLPEAWGHGYATEACAAAMAWFRAAAPQEPLVVSTQLANEASLRVIEKLGFVELERNEEWGAAQWFGAWLPPAAEQRAS